jgi:hypothetical protein
MPDRRSQVEGYTISTYVPNRLEIKPHRYPEKLLNETSAGRDGCKDGYRISLLKIDSHSVRPSSRISGSIDSDMRSLVVSESYSLRAPNPS